MPRGGKRTGAGRPKKTAGKSAPKRTPKTAGPPPEAPSTKSNDGPDPIRNGATTLERQRAFLAEFVTNGSVRRSCVRAGIPRSVVYETWLKDPAFKAAFDFASEEATDSLEEEARRRAVDGVLKPVHYQGVRCDTIVEYSDSLLMFLLRGRREIFREKRAIGVSAETDKNGGLRKVVIELDEGTGATAP